MTPSARDRGAIRHKAITPHPLRVAVDGRLMYYRKAGIAQYTRRLVQAIANAGLAEALPARPAELSVILDRRDTDLTWLPLDVRVRRAVTPAHHWLERLTLPIELAAMGIDVLHSPDFIAPSGKFRKVITIHDLYFWEHPEVMSRSGARYYRQVAASANRADAIIAVSIFTRREILRLIPGVPEQKITVIYEAADESRTEIGDWRLEIRESSSESLISNPQSPISILKSLSPYALFVGTFEPRKNLPTLLRALKELPADVKLVIVGEQGWGNQPRQKYARDLNVNDRVIFAGRLSDAELDIAYRAARVLALPSLSEGFGLPVLEAMARGTPVVCSNAGALPEVVGDAALLHDPLDASALARLIRMVWTIAPVYDDYARRGRERAAQFTWAKTARHTWDVYMQ